MIWTQLINCDLDTSLNKSTNYKWSENSIAIAILVLEVIPNEIEKLEKPFGMKL